MEAVGPRLDSRAHDSALKVPELGRGILGDEIEFLNRIRRRRKANQIVRHLIVVHTVEDKVVGLFPVAVDVRTAAIAAGVVAVVEAPGVGRHRARRKQSQLDVISCGERQFFIGPGIDDSVDLRDSVFRIGVPPVTSTFSNLPYFHRTSMRAT